MPDLKNISDADLEKEMARRQKQRVKVPTPLQSPDFTKLQAVIVQGVHTSIENEREDEDFEHYVYEAALEAVYGKNFWDWRNKQEW